VLINTAGSSNDFVGGTNGFGNVVFNGLPALSNGRIVDGLETNDPLTNLNSELSANLVLGLNSISEVTVNTHSYAVDQGRYGTSQVNYVTKSASNQFLGGLTARQIKQLQSHDWPGNIRGAQRSHASSGLTQKEMKSRERENAITALERTRRRIYRRAGTVVLLGLKPTTLAASLKVMDIHSPG
jgi:hypothetical protein